MVTVSFLAEHLQNAESDALEIATLMQYLGTAEYAQTVTRAQPHARIPSGKLTSSRANFNLMFQTYVGALQDASSNVAYLRPETAQGIFANFKNVMDSVPRQDPLRYRPDRQVLPQRDQSAQLHLPLARVRADGD